MTNHVNLEIRQTLETVRMGRLSGTGILPSRRSEGISGGRRTVTNNTFNPLGSSVIPPIRDLTIQEIIHREFHQEANIPFLCLDDFDSMGRRATGLTRAINWVRNILGRIGDALGQVFPITQTSETSQVIGEDFSVTVGRNGLMYNPVLAESIDLRRINVRHNDLRVTLYVPETDFEHLTEVEVKNSARLFTSTYENAIQRFSELGASIPGNTEFQIMFGKTRSGDPCSKDTCAYTSDMVSFSSPLSPGTRKIIEHEIGHSLTYLVLGEILRNPEFISIEEGLADYSAGLQRFMGGTENLMGGTSLFRITPEQARAMAGYTQLDFEAGLPQSNDLSQSMLYQGHSHHHFGLEFIHAFIETFSAAQLLPFLRGFSSFSQRDFTDHGSEFVKGKLRRMLWNDNERENKIILFEYRLFERLLGRVFSTTDGCSLE